MSLRVRVALWTFVTAILAAATLTTIFAVEARRSTTERLRGEGRRVAVSAVTLYDVLRLTGDDADRATLRAFLRAAVRGTSSSDTLAYAIVLDESGAWVAGDVAWEVLEEPARDDVTTLLAPPTKPHVLAVEANVVARNAADGAQAKAGRVLVGVSRRPADAALLRTLVVASAVSLLAALAFAGLLFSVLTRRMVKPISAVVDGMASLKTGALDVVVADPGGHDEAARLARGFNELVTALDEKEKLKSTLQRHVGKKLADDLAGMPPGTGKKLHVTALFLEVEGYAAREGRTPPEVTVAFLQELVSAAVDVVHAHDGHVARVMGDTLLALWGVPHARDDDALCATRAALALQDRCQKLSEARRARKEEEFTVGIGVATGDAVIASVGSAERAETVVAGEVITLARRIEEEAKALGFGVLLSSETFTAVDKQFEGAATPPVLVKGIGVPLTLFRVRARKRG